jgi:hypothetical protein
MAASSPANGWRARAPDGVAWGLLALATAGFFWRILFAGDWMPAGGGDLAALLYPTYHFAAQALKSGTLPLWNPYLWGGAPFAADIQASFFYPVNLLYFGLAPEITYRGVMLLAVFHIWLAGAGMYLFLKGLLPARPLIVAAPWLPGAPALLGALAFMFSDYFIVHFGNLNLIAQAAWLPFIFLFYHRSLAERRPGLAVWAGIFLAVAASAGHIQPVLFIVLALGWDLLYHLGAEWAGRRAGEAGHGRSAWPLVATLAVTLAVGLGLAACVLLPAYEMTGYTLRADYDYAQASRYSLAPAQLVGLAVPGFFGRDPAVHWGLWDRVEVGYAGVLTLLLGVFALLSHPHPRPLSPIAQGEVSSKNLEAGFKVPPSPQPSPSEGEGADREALVGMQYRFASLAILGLLLAMGGYAALHGWLYWLVPGLGSMRAPARSVFVLDFGLAALAALGLNALLYAPGEALDRALARLLRAAPWVIGAVILFALPLAFYAVITSQDKDPVIFARVSAAANGLVFFTGLLVAGTALFYLRRREGTHPAIVGALAVGLLFFDLASLGSNVDVGRDDPTRNFDHPAALQFLKSDASLYRIDTRTNVWDAWQPNTSLLNGLFDVGGLENPLSLADYDRYWAGIPSRSSSLYDFLNAKYVIAAKDVTLDWDKFAPVFDGDPAVAIYLNRRALPRALIVHQAIAARDHEAAFAALHVPGFDPATTVVIEGGEPLDVTTPSGAATIGLAAFGLNEIRLDVDTPADAYLVLSEVWYPGWRATVDGQPSPVLRANYAFRAVRLGPGQHQVQLTFSPDSWTAGLAVSGLTALAVIVWGLLKSYYRRR